MRFVVKFTCTRCGDEPFAAVVEETDGEQARRAVQVLADEECTARGRHEVVSVEEEDA